MGVIWGQAGQPGRVAKRFFVSAFDDREDADGLWGAVGLLWQQMARYFLSRTGIERASDRRPRSAFRPPSETPAQLPGRPADDGEGAGVRVDTKKAGINRRWKGPQRLAETADCDWRRMGLRLSDTTARMQRGAGC